MTGNPQRRRVQVWSREMALCLLPNKRWPVSLRSRTEGKVKKIKRRVGGEIRREKKGRRYFFVKGSRMPP